MAIMLSADIVDLVVEVETRTGPWDKQAKGWHPRPMLRCQHWLLMVTWGPMDLPKAGASVGE